MVRFELKQKEILDKIEYVFAFGYCKIQNLLSLINCTGYITRKEGWAADVYIMEMNYKNTSYTFAIITGYEPIGIKVKEQDYNIFEYTISKEITEEDKQGILMDFITYLIEKYILKVEWESPKEFLYNRVSNNLDAIQKDINEVKKQWKN